MPHFQVEKWAQQESVPLEDVYIWFDFCSVEQDDFDVLIRGVNTLGLYIACCDAFVAPDLVYLQKPALEARLWVGVIH